MTSGALSDQLEHTVLPICKSCFASGKQDEAKTDISFKLVVKIWAAVIKHPILFSWAALRPSFKAPLSALQTIENESANQKSHTDFSEFNNILAMQKFVLKILQQVMPKFFEVFFPLSSEKWANDFFLGQD